MRLGAARRGAIVYIVPALALLLGACGTPSRAPPTLSEELLARDVVYENEDGYWRLATPEQEGLYEASLRANLEAAIRTGADAFLVAKDGAIVCEWYSRRYSTPAYFMSSTKSVSSVVCGIMQDQGLLSFDDPVGKYVPEWSQGRRGKVTIRHLLTQTSGLLQDAHPGFYQTGGARDAFLRAMDLDVEPGSRWSYSNEGCQLLSPVMEAACGGRLLGFARENLFHPWACFGPGSTPTRTRCGPTRSCRPHRAILRG